MTNCTACCASYPNVNDEDILGGLCYNCWLIKDMAEMDRQHLLNSDRFASLVDDVQSMMRRITELQHGVLTADEFLYKFGEHADDAINNINYQDTV